MCGRFTMHHGIDELVARFKIAELQAQLDLSYDIAPSQQVAVVTEKAGSRILDRYKWGLVPHWAEDESIGYKMINARAETVAVKPSFKSALKQRRCLIPADGFFEWRREGQKKIPQHFRLKNGETFGFAGLWETWKPKSSDEAPLHSCTIITTEANSVVAPIHNRMPVILRPEFEEAWLDPDLDDTDELVQFLKPFEAEMEAYEVSTKVNTPAFDAPECIEPSGDETPRSEAKAKNST